MSQLICTNDSCLCVLSTRTHIADVTLVYHLRCVRYDTHNVFSYVSLSMTLEFKFKRLSRKNGFLIHGIRKYSTVHRRGQDEKN
jgi:hypothetical protein